MAPCGDFSFNSLIATWVVPSSIWRYRWITGLGGFQKTVATIVVQPILFLFLICSLNVYRSLLYIYIGLLRHLNSGSSTRPKSHVENGRKGNVEIKIKKSWSKMTKTQHFNFSKIDKNAAFQFFQNFRARTLHFRGRRAQIKASKLCGRRAQT